MKLEDHALIFSIICLFIIPLIIILWNTGKISKEKRMVKKIQNQSYKGRAIASMVLGIISVVLWSAMGIGVICGIIGLSLGYSTKKLIKESQKLEGIKMANAGVILSIIGITAGVVFVFIIFANA